jgi:hypothetical protein
VRAMEPLRLSEMLRGLEGKWVAIRRGEVVQAADSADALFKRLRSRQIRDASAAGSHRAGAPGRAGRTGVALLL